MLALCALATACKDTSGGSIARVPEDFLIVPGRPEVEYGAPGVLLEDAGDTSGFRINVTRQCDVYQQVDSRQVDILWVVDSSGSMAPKQARLNANFQAFIDRLVPDEPDEIPVNFNIAVVSTDADDPAERGRLHPWSFGGGDAGLFISCGQPDAGDTVCNTAPGMPVADGGAVFATRAFEQMATVGTSGTAAEEGLYAAYLALTNPNNIATTANPNRFIRPGAALYVVIVSDEDDSSCSPLIAQPVCTADPGCRCASDSRLNGANAFGSTDFFTRFFETYKGYGNQDLVAVAAIIAVDSDAGVPSQFQDPGFHVGCCRNPDGGVCPTVLPDAGVLNGAPAGLEIGYFGDRYNKVATATGGVAVSICENDFAGALGSLGYAASGLRRDFRLTRPPEMRLSGVLADGVELHYSPLFQRTDAGVFFSGTCAVDGNCQDPAFPTCRSGRCAVRRPVAIDDSTDQQFVQCESGAFRNSVRFDTTASPAPRSVVEICYDVDSDVDPASTCN